MIQYAEKDHSGPWIEVKLERVLMDIYSQARVFIFFF